MDVLKIAGWFVEAVQEKCDNETARSVADSVLDKVEDYVTGTANPIDDLLKPLIKKCIREPFGIPDNNNVDVTTKEDAKTETAEGAGDAADDDPTAR